MVLCDWNVWLGENESRCKAVSWLIERTRLHDTGISSIQALCRIGLLSMRLWARKPSPLTCEEVLALYVEAGRNCKFYTCTCSQA